MRYLGDGKYEVYLNNKATEMSIDDLNKIMSDILRQDDLIQHGELQAMKDEAYNRGVDDGYAAGCDECGDEWEIS